MQFLYPEAFSSVLPSQNKKKFVLQIKKKQLVLCLLACFNIESIFYFVQKFFVMS